MATLISAIGSYVARMTRGANAIQIMTMKVSKCLEFPVVPLPGLGHMLLRAWTSRRLLWCCIWRLR